MAPPPSPRLIVVRSRTVPPAMVKAEPTAEQRLAAAALAEARDALAKGQVDEARRLLRSSASSDSPGLWFQLAETYDPNFANTWAQSLASDASGSLLAADVGFARFYYQRAYDAGVAGAKERLDALP